MTKKHIVVVDDEVDLAELIASEISDYGYQVTICHSGNEALTVIQNQLVDFVVSDIKMQDGDGMALLREIRKINSRVPVFAFMSGYTEIPLDKIIEAGAVGLLDKPVCIADLISIIAQHIK